ncbi:NAD(P)-dependent glycerol-3-phosphate dehydrogenase [Candidatus Babeliales bacterium]|nr:NAD(P)-dependent glycerol-3-phosphate dehydrogenase [Candidatus Babeliales bacterium]MCF7899822.1 NAD(P)-dependent glycerol-3-phosphate dehydrogenase [Candidatus Babeliales bacterium]
MSGTVTVIGAGAFGTAFATLLANNNFQVKLWCYEKEVVQDILQNQENSKYLPNIKLSSKITPTNDMQKALEDTTWVFEAVPVKFLRQILMQAKKIVKKDQIFVCLSKGIEQETAFLPSNIIKNVLGTDTKIGVVSGPNFAHELATNCSSGATISCCDVDLTQELAKNLKNSYFMPYMSKDLVGIQVAGALKNVLVLIVGIARGYLSSQNTIAFLLTRGFAEISKLCKFLGGEPETVYGLCGLGDLFLSSSSLQSRNMKVGQLLGEGKNLKAIEKKLGILPEGINTVQSVYKLIQKHNLDLPICTGIYQMIFENRSFNNFLDDIMNSDLMWE